MKEEIIEENFSVDNKSFTNKMRENPWILSSIVLGVVVLLFVFGNFGGGVTGNVISSDDAGKKLLSYYAQGGANGLELDSVTEANGLYQVNFKYQGAIVPIYMTKDGSMAGSMTALVAKDDSATTDNSASKEIVKSDKPIVELYVFTYCPYGTQSEKGIIPVVKLLGDKIDFKIRQIGAMHGEYEKIEAERQLCIEKNYPTKLLDYDLDFALSSEIGACRGDATCVNPLIDKLYSKLGIDKTKIESCMKSDGEKLYSAEEDNSRTKGVGGSPTLLINGQNVQSGRDSASYLSTICSAFTEGNVPEVCSQTLSSTAPSPGFGSGSSSSSSAANCVV